MLFKKKKKEELHLHANFHTNFSWRQAVVKDRPPNPGFASVPLPCVQTWSCPSTQHTKCSVQCLAHGQPSPSQTKRNSYEADSEEIRENSIAMI